MQVHIPTRAHRHTHTHTHTHTSTDTHIHTNRHFRLDPGRYIGWLILLTEIVSAYSFADMKTLKNV